MYGFLIILGMETSKRVSVIDLGRFVALSFMVMLHVLQRTYPNFTSTWGSVYLLVISVTPFVFFSGMSYSYKKELRPVGFLYDILKRGFAYMLPLIWFLLFRVLLYGQWVDVPAAFSDFLEYPVNGLWICWVLLWIVLFVDVGLLLASLCPKFKVLFVTMVLVLAYTTLLLLRHYEVIPSDHFLAYDYFVIYVPVFLVGYLLGRLVFKFDNPYVSLSCLLAGAGGLVPIAINNPIFIQVKFLEAQWMFYLACFCAAIAYYGLLNLLKQVRFSKGVSFAGRFSMEMYFLHLMLLKNWGHLDLPGGWAIFGVTLGLYLLCFANTAIVTLVTYFVPFLHFALFGRHYSHYAFENALFDKLHDTCLSK